VRRALRADLPEPGTDLDRYRGLDQLAGDQRDRLTNEIAVLTRHHLGEDVSSSHPVPFGHRGAPSQSALW
jgi:hypothetical protein